MGGDLQLMKSLSRLSHDQGCDVIVYENAAFPHKKARAALVAAPLPKGDLFAREIIEGMNWTRAGCHQEKGWMASRC
jgi:hypothetical protein